ncbi:glycosyltransferase [Flavobacterium daemonense]|uniref:glycosyltransferase n=1 Tax=Flavobacterium daemonense TaxID=1393049 RepID=UPI001186942D|nr:glycosyltransferase [Flavobacterium daemonense]KAF2332513.1 glycosyltransferase family 4 protein [Flavobacterium daemonense]
MKILLVHSHYQLKGGEDAVLEQELELLKQNHVVEVLRFQNQDGWKGAFQFLFSIWNIDSASIIKKKIREFNPDVVHVHNWHFAIGPLVFREVKKLGVPVFHTIHNYRLLCPSGILLYKGKLFTESLHQSFPWKAIRYKVYRSSILLTFWLSFVVWFHKKIGTWKKIDSYVCLTSFAINLFEQSNFGVRKERFIIKPNFTDKCKELMLNERENYFLFIGRLSEEKGIKNLLEAFKELPFELKIAGNGPAKQLVLDTAEEHANICYLGKLTNEQVSKELQKTQALIFPSVWYEGMPMTILEAFSASTPVLSSNLGAMTSLISDGSNGFLFDPDCTKDLKAIVAKFNRLSVLEKKQMGINAFQTYQLNYRPELQLPYFDFIYNQAIKRN